MLVSTELRDRRRALGLTQAGLAMALGVASNTVARWERGETVVGNPELVHLALERLEAGGSNSSKARRSRRDTWEPVRVAEAHYHAGFVRGSDMWLSSLSSFVGRESEVAEIKRLLGAHRLVTLTGVGGVGKSRLAQRVAADVSDRFVDGTVVVPLASITDPALVAFSLAQRLGVTGAGERVSGELLQHILRDKQLLLVLDNFEQVLPAAPLVAALLGTCPALQVLVTSRAVLRISGEHAVSVPPLALPARGLPHALERLSHCESVRLFMDRAQAVKPSFSMTIDTAPLVVEICQRLDGLPLAIELAAACVRILTPQAIVGRLGRRLDLLVNGARDGPERHQTMRAAIAWSYDLLSLREQVAFRRLAVFAGGWTLDAAAAVSAPCQDRSSRAEAEGEMLNLLISLVEQGLVQAGEQPDGAPRFDMLETIREYGLERLVANREEHASRQRHTTYFLALAEELGTEKRTLGPDGPACLDGLEREHDNFRAALRWTLDSDSPSALRLVSALEHLWSSRGHFSEGRRWLDEALRLPEGRLRTRARAALLYAAGRIAHRQGDLSAGGAFHTETLAIARELGDPWLEASALFGLGFNASQRADFAGARALYEDALALYRALGDRLRAAMVVGNLSVEAWRQEDYAAVRMHCAEAVSLARELDSPFLLAHAFRTLGLAAYGEGDQVAALKAFEEGLLFAERAMERWLVGYLLEYLGLVKASLGRVTEARAHYLESLRVHRQTGERPGIVRALEGVARVIADELPEQALQVAGAVEAMRDALDTPRSPREQRVLEVWRTRATRVLGQDRAGAAWMTGRGLSVEQASELAATSSLPAARPPDPSPQVGLTPREQEVLRLLAHGRTNTDIAHRLVLSIRTVERHIANIYAKIGARGRADAAVYASRHGLARPEPCSPA